MKINKKQETAARKAYEVYFDSYIKGDITNIEPMLDDNYNQIGSAESEVFFNKQDALKFLHDTIDQVAGKTEMRNRTIKIDPLKDYFLVTDLFDIYVLIEGDWAFYSKFRASTLMQEIDGQWKFIHQHSSVPDLKAQEGENIAIEKVSKENLELREAIKRRTIELEHKNRELEIEAALERVRTKTMAMRNSHDVGDTVVSLFDEVLKLGLDKSIRCGIGILDKETDHMETWSATSYPGGEVDLKMGLLDMRIHPMLIGLKKAWNSGKSGYQYDYIGDDVLKYYKALNNEPEYPFQKDLNSLPENEYHRSFFYSEGILFAFAPNPISEEAARVLNRFAGVFGQTYRRYLDLKKAEAQAREAQIEAALERVRARSMAMQNTDELREAGQLLYQELGNLGINSLTSGYVLMDDDEIIGWNYLSDPVDGNIYPKPMGIPHQKTEVMRTITKSWKNQEPYHVLQLDENGTIKHQTFIAEHTINFHLSPEELIALTPERLALQTFNFKEGYLLIVGAEPLTEEEIQMMLRFTGVFKMTYQRFLDLHKAEEQAKEAVKQSSLDRVRAEIASMRSAIDLQRITPIVWAELITLGVPFFRCGVFIIDENAQIIHAYLSTPEGRSLGVLHISFDSSKTNKEVVNHWRHQKVYSDHWDKQQFMAWTKSMIEQGQIKAEEQFQAGQAPPESLSLQFIPFTQGMLYVGSSDPLSEDQIDLVKSLAEAFSVAYARYDDFRKLEEAKDRVENTLDDLKAAQNQLIQSEKMASLGELTAGIAHEIQNPLNFVNNFSELNKELAEELNDEIEKGNLEEAKGIARDIIENEQKISHHGKRAETIVKGMLQHSRSSSGQKEMTDLSVLADEYLRLAYHGLRAKNKSFNADYHLEIDENLPKIKVIPQEIGRVLLNLINNAFYAVSSKASATEDIGYKPKVSVSTKMIKLDNERDAVEIRIKDNGYGIPSSLKDKIFQPFFTTKPTGEGTGLGLSISYDIITKGHGGEVKVESIAESDNEMNKKVELGTEFIITLPQ